MNLSRPQISALMDGKEEMIKIQEKEREKKDDKQPSNLTPKQDKQGKGGQVNSLGDLISAPGINLTPKAKERLAEEMKGKDK